MNTQDRIAKLVKQIPASYNAAEEIQMALLTSAGCVDLTRNCGQLCGSWNGIPVTSTYTHADYWESAIAVFITLGHIRKGGSVQIRATAGATEIFFNHNYNGPWNDYHPVTPDMVQAFLKAFMPQFCTVTSWNREGIPPQYTYSIAFPDRKDLLARSDFASDEAFRLAVSDAVTQQDAAWRQERVNVDSSYLLSILLKSPQAKYMADDIFPQRRKQGANCIDLNLHDAITLWASLDKLTKQSAINLRAQVASRVYGATGIPIEDLA